MAIHNLTAIWQQSKHETAGEYRTRGATMPSHDSEPLKGGTPLNHRVNISVIFHTTRSIDRSSHTGMHLIRHSTHPHWALFIQSLPNTRHTNDSSSSQNLTWTLSYSQFKILQQSQCNRRTKRPGNIEPDEDIYHVHFKPNKILRHPYKQKYCVIHINGSLFRKMFNKNQIWSMTCISEQECLLL